MQALCQQLHTEFAKLEHAHLSAKRKLFEFGEGADNETEVKQSVKQLESATKVYEDFCRTAQKLPDGRNIWLPDYLALVNLAELMFPRRLRKPFKSLRLRTKK